MENRTTPELTHRFLDALQFAFEKHRMQIRKGTGVPYFSHILAVTALVLENGGDEDQAIAALLHDVVEDQGGLNSLREIQNRYGARVADLVSDLSDTVTQPKPPWRMRKQTYLEHLPKANPDSILISVADKVHNARSLVLDYQREGGSIWARFNASKTEILWYYTELAAYFDKAFPGTLTVELSKSVNSLRRYIQDEAT